MTSKIIYKGNLRTEACHLRSGNTIITDAPVDNKGMGEAFSPTDLIATALASCMVTIMGIKADEMKLNVNLTTISVEKIMASKPRRIAIINTTIKIPLKTNIKNQRILEKTALTCPVAQSLSPEIEHNVEFIWA